MRSAAWFTGCCWEQKKPPHALAGALQSAEAALASNVEAAKFRKDRCFMADLPSPKAALKVLGA
jgi:hypothetical protein